MITVLSNARNASLYLIAVVGIALAVLLTRPSLPLLNVTGPAPMGESDSQKAQDLFRQEELAIYSRPAASSIGSPAFYEYRQGEWPTAGVDAIGAFRQEELSLYNRTESSSIGGPAFMEYRRGEWFGE